MPLLLAGWCCTACKLVMPILTPLLSQLSSAGKRCIAGAPAHVASNGKLRTNWVSRAVAYLQAYDQHLNMILGEVEETITTVEIDDETYEEIIKVSGVSICSQALPGQHRWD
eukprot:GHUV01040609.1.p1 GENE.GHUV01040609.1~~GHUV01040609.1.p1  ORF type:complete len:112 (-),score=6.99 GHUV01040609.1:155-490(-)